MNQNKLTLVLIAAILIGGQAFSQTDTTKPKSWQISGLYSLTTTQTTLTNWAAGGNNNVNINALLKQKAVLTKNKWVWNNLLEANYGHNFQKDFNNKTDDRLEFTSRVDRQLKETTWFLSGFLNARTQFTDGFSSPTDSVRISTLMAPAYLTYGLGLTNKSFKGLSIYFSPITVKQTVVLDNDLFAKNIFFDATAPNVSTLGNGGMRTEMGAFLNMAYAKALAENFEVNSKLNLFSNYLDRPGNIDVNWETLFLMKVYSVLTVSLQLQLIYDHDVNVRYANDLETADGAFNAPGTQFRQILGVGIAYTFGEYKN